MLIERNKFIVIRRRDMIHENTNTIIMQQLYHKERTRTSFVVANYTIIFIILVHFIHRADLTNQVIMMTPVHGCTIFDTNAMYESTRRILFPACWLLIDWLVEIQRQPTLELAKVSHWKSCVQGSTHFDTSSKHNSPSTMLHFSLLWLGELQVIGKHWQVPKSKSHCLKPTSLSLKT